MTSGLPPAKGAVCGVHGDVEPGRRKSVSGGVGEVDAAGAPIVRNREEPWPTCDPLRPVRFPMGPAYVVDGRVYGLQGVYTG